MDRELCQCFVMHIKTLKTLTSMSDFTQKSVAIILVAKFHFNAVVIALSEYGDFSIALPITKGKIYSNKILLLLKLILRYLQRIICLQLKKLSCRAPRNL